MSTDPEEQQLTALELAHKLASSVYAQAMPSPEGDLALAQVFATIAHTEALEAHTTALDAHREAVERLYAHLALSGSTVRVVADTESAGDE